MGVEILTTEKNKRLNTAALTINFRQNRMILNRETVKLLSKNGAPDYVQLLTDKNQPGIFWIKTCEPNTPGSRKLNVPSPNTRTCHISSLLKNLELDTTTGVLRLKTCWDEKLEAVNIDTSQPL